MNNSISLRDFFNTRLAQMETSFKEHFKVIEDARIVAFTELSRRLEEMNKFREENRGLTNSFISRVEYEAKYGAILNDIESLKLTRAELSGKASQASVWITAIISILGLLSSVSAIIVSFLK